MGIKVCLGKWGGGTLGVVMVDGPFMKGCDMGRIGGWRKAWAVALAAGMAVLGTAAHGEEEASFPPPSVWEGFGDTGLPGTGKTWSLAGGFTNAETGMEWAWTSARGTPRIREEDPVLALRGASTGAQRGTLMSVSPLTNGIGRVRFTAMLDSTSTNAAIQLDLLADGNVFATCGAPGAENGEAVELEAVPTAAPLVSVDAFCISNKGATCVIDDLEIEPFRLFVAVEGPEGGDLPLSRETDIEAKLWHAAAEVEFEWTIEPPFAGWANDWGDPHLTLLPAAEDLGKTFTLTAHLSEAGDSNAYAEASCELTVSDSMNPRFLDFEDARGINYNTNDGAVVEMRGMNWRWFNVCSSDARDAKIGAASARFRHTSLAAPAILESLDPFDGVGAVTLHCAGFQSNRTVNFELQVMGDGEDWTTVGEFSSRDCLDITNSVFVLQVQRRDAVCVRLVTTGLAGEIADIDNISILPYGESPPLLAADIPPIAVLGRPTEVVFTLLHAEGMVREWTTSLEPPSEAAEFEELPGGDCLFTFLPETEADFGEYSLSVAAEFPDGTTCRTQATVRVVEAPSFELAGTESIVVPGVVDVAVANVALHGANTNDWRVEWSAEPGFANTPTVAHKSRYRIGGGTTEADVGTHVLTAVLTDLGTTAKTTNTLAIVVSSTNEPAPPTPIEETYWIESYAPPMLCLRATNTVPRVFTVFAVESPLDGNEEPAWVWSSAPATSAAPALVEFDLSEFPSEGRSTAMFGVRISSPGQESDGDGGDE